MFTEYDSEFDNKADWKILFNFSLQQLIKNPFLKPTIIVFMLIQ